VAGLAALVSGEHPCIPHLGGQPAGASTGTRQLPPVAPLPPLPSHPPTPTPPPPPPPAGSSRQHCCADDDCWRLAEPEPEWAAESQTTETSMRARCGRDQSMPHPGCWRWERPPQAQGRIHRGIHRVTPLRQHVRAYLRAPAAAPGRRGAARQATRQAARPAPPKLTGMRCPRGWSPERLHKALQGGGSASSARHPAGELVHRPPARCARRPARAPASVRRHVASGFRGPQQPAPAASSDVMIGGGGGRRGGKGAGPGLTCCCPRPPSPRCCAPPCFCP
jgi:hypothetical protein